MKGPNKPVENIASLVAAGPLAKSNVDELWLLIFDLLVSVVIFRLGLGYGTVG